MIKLNWELSGEIKGFWLSAGNHNPHANEQMNNPVRAANNKQIKDIINDHTVKVMRCYRNRTSLGMKNHNKTL